MRHVREAVSAAHCILTAMSARRQPSTTSLARFARAGSPDPNVPSLDYCNNFWGIADGGVEVLFARMRGAARTMEELRNFWKERCVVWRPARTFTHHLNSALLEEDYAKRLAKLAKTTVGRDEIGSVRVTLYLALPLQILRSIYGTLPLSNYLYVAVDAGILGSMNACPLRIQAGYCTLLWRSLPPPWLVGIRCSVAPIREAISGKSAQLRLLAAGRSAVPHWARTHQDCASPLAPWLSRSKWRLTIPLQRLPHRS